MKGTFLLGVKYAIKSVANLHTQGSQSNIFLFATARGGSTWVMELIASQPGMKYYDEPFNVRRHNLARTGLFPTWDDVMPDTANTEKIVRYLKDLEAGRYRHMNPPPFRRNHRFLTNRIVFKIHELEHLVGTIARRCNGMVVYLLRHPIPTTLSRSVLPRLEHFVKSRFYEDLLGEHRTREIRALVAAGSHLQRGVVSWCYENVIPLTRRDFEGLFITYEELVLNPVRSRDLLVDRLDLPDRKAMQRAFDRPSANIAMSSAETRAVMSQSDQRRKRSRLVTRWKSSVSREDESAVSDILALFGLDVYTGHRPLAAAQYLHFDDTAGLLEAGAEADRATEQPAVPRDARLVS